MGSSKSTKQIWSGRTAGLIVPSGSFSDLTQSSSHTYLHIKEKALALQSLFLDSKVPLDDTTDLVSLIDNAKRLSDLWLLGQDAGNAMPLVFRAMILDRIADAVLPLAQEPNRIRFLNDLLFGNLDLLGRTRSRAKDAFWELELWATLKQRSFDVALEEPPDLVINLDDKRIGIACKKLYSEKHVQNVLSQAVAQIEANFDFGIVALNLDDLWPANQILTRPTDKAMGQAIANFNSQFLSRHKRHFKKYLTVGRVISALVSSSILADVCNAQPRFTYASQVTVWTIPGLPQEKHRQLNAFYGRLMG